MKRHYFSSKNQKAITSGTELGKKDFEYNWTNYNTGYCISPHGIVVMKKWNNKLELKFVYTNRDKSILFEETIKEKFTQQGANSKARAFAIWAAEEGEKF